MVLRKILYLIYSLFYFIDRVGAVLGVFEGKASHGYFTSKVLLVLESLKIKNLMKNLLFNFQNLPH